MLTWRADGGPGREGTQCWAPGNSSAGVDGIVGKAIMFKKEAPLLPQASMADMQVGAWGSEQRGAGCADHRGGRAGAAEAQRRSTEAQPGRGRTKGAHRHAVLLEEGVGGVLVVPAVHTGGTVSYNAVYLYIAVTPAAEGCGMQPALSAACCTQPSPAQPAAGSSNDNPYAAGGLLPLLSVWVL